MVESGVFHRQPILQRRVVVTGLGALTPLGLDASTSWKNAVDGKSGIRRIDSFDPSLFDAQIAGQVSGFEPDKFVQKKEQKKMDTFIHYALATTQMALADSGLPLESLNLDRVGVFVSTGIGGLPGIERTYATYMEKGPSRITPFFIPMVISNLASGQIGIQYKFKGPNLCITSACATGAHSIGEAVNYIRRGDADVMIAGGTESVVCPLAIGGFSAMKALSTRNSEPQKASRPFDRDRDGFVLGEGAGILVLEDYESASRRGARIYAEVTGFGSTCDGYHMTNPSPQGDGATRSMQMALRDASLTPSDIHYINAHGTSTPVGDELETLAIKRVFQDFARKIPVSSTKSMTGHLLGAAGAMESVFCLLALQDQVAPPTINLENPSPQCDLDYVPLVARDVKIKNAMNNSFGFGGTNATLIFSQV